MKHLTLCLAFLAVTACGGDDSSDGTTDDSSDDPAIDASPVDGSSIDGSMIDGGNIDAAVSHIEVVTCPATPDATVTTSGFMFAPMATTITVGQVVQFTMPSIHNVVPDGADQDPNLRVGFSETKCLKFTAAGLNKFMCMPHMFKGTITVSP